MKKSPIRNFRVLLGLGVCALACAARAEKTPAPADDAARIEAGWARAMATWNPRTGVVTGCDSRKSLPPPDATNNLYRMYEGRPGGWGPPGVGDAPLICGTALSGLVDKWAVTRDPAVKEEAAKVAKGVLSLAVLHGYPGFVCRGFCSDDRTTVSLSSRDQYTHWAHGLWRYVAADGLADPARVQECRVRFAEVAAFMEARVTEASGWNFGLADSPERDPRGICTMWGPEVWPHEIARLPMIYCTAFLVTGDAHWRDLYERYIDEALDRTLAYRTLPPNQVAGRVPCYALYQASTSLEPILAYEAARNPARAEKARAAQAMFADAARQRAEKANPAKPPYGMCWDGELALTQLMAPTFPAPDELAAFVAATVRRQDLARSGVCRVAHVMAAYWRFAVRAGSRVVSVGGAERGNLQAEIDAVAAARRRRCAPTARCRRPSDPTPRTACSGTSHHTSLRHSGGFCPRSSASTTRSAPPPPIIGAWPTSTRASFRPLPRLGTARHRAKNG